MKCKHALQRLLATSGRRTLAAEVREHLDGCASCRHWHDRLAEIDGAVPRLAIPDSGAAKSALVARFLAPPVFAEPSWGLVRPKLTWPRAAAAAAALVVFGLAVAGVFNREKRPPAGSAPDALLARVLDRNLELAAADNVNKRVVVLANLANDLDQETRNLARVSPADDLNSLADLYESVMRGDKGLVARSDDLPAGDRKAVLEPIARRLQLASDSADKLSLEVPPAAKAALHRIATAAREARLNLSEKIARVRTNDDEKLAQEAPPRPGEGKS